MEYVRNERVPGKMEDVRNERSSRTVEGVGVRGLSGERRIAGRKGVTA